MHRLPPLIAAGIVSAFIAVASVNAARQLVIPRNSVGTQQIRNGAILPADLNRSTVTWLNAGAPAARARGVTVSNGTNGDRVRVTGANIRADGDLVGQFEYLGGLTCPNFGPTMLVEATFFSAAGVAVDTGGDLESNPRSSVRYPLDIFGPAGAVRAEAVASVSCS
jgi:hypothetical protein